MRKYQSLTTILDRLRSEAPTHLKVYRPLETDQEKVDQARSRAFIHMFLLVRFGILEFEDRERLMTEGAYDGGIDAYFIDTANRKIYFIQSKFRTTEHNFDTKNIEPEELLAMDVERITRGIAEDEKGNKYNGKIQGLIRHISQVEDIGRYDFIIVILANIKPMSDEKLKQLVGSFHVQRFDHSRCYTELVFPLISGTYFNASDLSISIDLLNKDFAQSRIRYPVDTEEIDCEITLLFVPTIEIAKVLYKYRNSILIYNPRSYLSLSSNTVNQEIARTITDIDTNEFSLYNNGITMLSDETRFTERTGRPATGQLTVKSPQIINGGQTAFTLNHIYSDALENGLATNFFDGKEVMLKVITFVDPAVDEAKRLKLIEAISKATNQQSPVVEADRRSNDKIQVEIQKKIYDDFGYFYERKKGEFFDGLKHHYLNSDSLIDRELLLRIAFAISGSPEGARRSSGNVLFAKQTFDSIYKSSNEYRELFFSYLCYQRLGEIQGGFSSDPNNRFGVANYGNALRYGKFAVLYVTRSQLKQGIVPSNVNDLAKSAVNHALDRWLEFEDYAKKRAGNHAYFYEVLDEVTGEKSLETNFDSYYKVINVRRDLDKFFQIKAETI